ncbi:PaaX family transcriptional regulator C-terminal domain-containing protein [Maritimibacter sp. DP1N21-5]|uniref:PaaX family transcriptional regulator C-terminal domain-containing protein n=1 Tax=Maritimibacter sp. DP1N21-5 TaxID=2836867 RepID=UPI001C452526|nr:PaaX family transcriptional regulator C-terminal domain-containing protein [Maritimibacter sp. DP1N21-5]MBV7409298.1 hypothetical protein [Maritimibacter sp. DP1N21-5]
MTLFSPSTQSRIDALMAVGPVKVWSVVVTVMGDLCRRPGDRLSGRTLDMILAPMGINNQALRTALHRLKRDGWIEAARDGRGSSYALTPLGRDRTEAVRPIIYAAGPSAVMPVHLILPDPSLPAPDLADFLPEDSLVLPHRAALFAGPEQDLPEGALIASVPSGPLPDWLRDSVADPELCAEYEALCTATLFDLPRDPIARLVVRLAAFHHYRRLRLRHGDLPDLLLGPTWPGARARSRIADLRAECPRPAISTLQAVAEA